MDKTTTNPSTDWAELEKAIADCETAAYLVSEESHPDSEHVEARRKVKEIYESLLSRKEEEVRENEKKHWLEGMRCTNCGGNKNPNELSDMCGKCFEEA